MLRRRPGLLSSAAFAPRGSDFAKATTDEEESAPYLLIQAKAKGDCCQVFLDYVP